MMPKSIINLYYTSMEKHARAGRSLDLDPLSDDG